ncbi:hypothetical protein ACT3CD_15530 [Geofilum sp. OHC36d9]|uniref:hypothetical protein n=1 Tax=Geofilum sp. OHC36d9 TaxID=3458413 RepID=UPI004033FCCA
MTIRQADGASVSQIAIKGHSKSMYLTASSKGNRVKNGTTTPLCQNQVKCSLPASTTNYQD